MIPAHIPHFGRRASPFPKTDAAPLHRMTPGATPAEAGADRLVATVLATSVNESRTRSFVSSHS